MGNCLTLSPEKALNGKGHAIENVHSLAQTRKVPHKSSDKPKSKNQAKEAQAGLCHNSEPGSSNVAEKDAPTSHLPALASVSASASASNIKAQNQQASPAAAPTPTPAKTAPPPAKTPAAPAPAATAPATVVDANARKTTKQKSSRSLRTLPPSDASFYVIRKTDDVTDKYRIAEELGHGQFGVVSIAINKETGQHFAIKSMSKRKAEADPRFFKDIRNEVEIMYHLVGNANIAQLHEVYEDEDTIHLIMDLCTGGDWFGCLIAHGTYSEYNAAETIRTLLETLSYCHSLGVVHRDIKPENVLLMNSSPGCPVKLADFGLSAMLPPAALQGAAGKGEGLLHDAVGSAYYVAPEVLTSRGYGYECDVWSLGIVLYIVLGGYPPFDGENEEKVLHAVVHSPLRFDSNTWTMISSSAKDMICRMLNKDPRKRATIPDLLSHPWLELCRKSSSDNTQEVVSKPTCPPRGPRQSNVPDAVVTRLQQFAAMNLFKKQARKVLAAFLPEEEVVGLLNIFKAMDTDGNGVLTVAELRAALKVKGALLPADKAEELLRCVDLNRDGVIDYEEFLAATVHQMRLDKDELLHRAFRHFDHNLSGYVSKKDVQAVMDLQGLEVDVDAILRAVDVDRDGRINYKEFCNYMRMHEEVLSKSGRLTVRSLSRRLHSGNSRSRGGRELTLLNSFCSRASDSPEGSPTHDAAVQAGKAARANNTRFHPDPMYEDLASPQGNAGTTGHAKQAPAAHGALCDPLMKVGSSNRLLTPLPRDHYNGADRQLLSIRSRKMEAPLPPPPIEESKKEGAGSPRMRVSNTGKRRHAVRSGRPSSRMLLRDASSRCKADMPTGLHAKPSRSSHETVAATAAAAVANRGLVSDTMLLPNCTNSREPSPDHLRRQTEGGMPIPLVDDRAHCKSSAASCTTARAAGVKRLPSIGRSSSASMAFHKLMYSEAWSKHIAAEDAMTMSFATTHRSHATSAQSSETSSCVPFKRTDSVDPYAILAE